MLCDRGPHFLQQLFQLYVPGARDQDFVERIQDLLMVGDLVIEVGAVEVGALDSLELLLPVPSVAMRARFIKASSRESRTALVGGTVSPGRSRYRRRGAVRLMAPLESRTEA